MDILYSLPVFCQLLKQDMLLKGIYLQRAYVLTHLSLGSTQFLLGNSRETNTRKVSSAKKVL